MPKTILLSLLLIGCSDSMTSSSSTAVDAPAAASADAPGAAAVDARPAATADAPPAGATPDAPAAATPDAPSGTSTFTLTIDNYLGWCSITVNGGMAFTDMTKSFTLPASSHAQLHGDTSDSIYFVWGFWSGTDAGDHDASKSTTVTMTGDKTVRACCPDVGQTTCP